MQNKTIIPRSVSRFAEYMKLAYEAAETHLSAYGIPPAELAKITPLYRRFARLELLCASPATATGANRDARNRAKNELEKQWRVFLNREIRYNEAISVAEKEIFGLLPHDRVRSPAERPKETGMLLVVRKGYCRYECAVADAATGRKKRPRGTAGSSLYVCVVEAREPAPLPGAFRFEGFSSACRHTVQFSEDRLAKRAFLFVRYTNSRGQEGPDGPLTTFIVS